MHGLGVGHRVAEPGDGGVLVSAGPDDDRPALGLGASGAGAGADPPPIGRVVDHRPDVLAPGAVGLDGREDDRVGARPQRERDRECERLLRFTLGLLMHLDPVEGDRRLSHAATGRDDGG